MTGLGRLAGAIGPAGDDLAGAHDAAFDHLITIAAAHSHDRPFDAARRRAQRAAQAGGAAGGP